MAILDKVFNNDKNIAAVQDPALPKGKRVWAATKLVGQTVAEGWVLGLVGAALVIIVVGAFSSDTAEIEIPTE